MTNEKAIKILNSLKPSISYGGHGDCKTFNSMVTEALNKAIDALSGTTTITYDPSSLSIKPLSSSGEFTANWYDTIGTQYTVFEGGQNVYHLARS